MNDAGEVIVADDGDASSSPVPAPDAEVVIEPIPSSSVETSSTPSPAPLPPDPAPEIPVVQVEPSSPSITETPSQGTETNGSAPQVVERVVEKVVEKEVIKEVIKEVPVDRIVEKIVEKEVVKEVPVEKIVERVVEKIVHVPPTKEEFDAMLEEYMTHIGKKGVATKQSLMLEKEAKILTLFDTQDTIRRKDVMELLDCSPTTATRLLHILTEEGRLIMGDTNPKDDHQGGNSAYYTRPRPS